MGILINSLFAALLIKLAKWLGYSAQEFEDLLKEVPEANNG